MIHTYIYITEDEKIRITYLYVQTDYRTYLDKSSKLKSGLSIWKYEDICKYALYTIHGAFSLC